MMTSLLLMLACTPNSGKGGAAGVTDAIPTAGASTTVDAAAEDCTDALDNDGDGLIDCLDPDCYSDPDVEGTLWFRDADGDGFGAADDSVNACKAPVGYTADNTDCADDDASVYPGALDLCDGLDNACKGFIAINEIDTDGDGYVACMVDAGGWDGGLISGGGDCNPDEGTVYPGAVEVCDGIDQDCDGAEDPDLIGTGEDCPAENCLELVEAGVIEDTSSWWVTGLAGPELIICDTGTVGDGWGWRAEVTLVNDTGDVLHDHPVALVFDGERLVDEGKLVSLGDDLRIFSSDGPLLTYWYASPLSAVTEVWATAARIPEGESTLTLTFGNPGTERRSMAWHYDPFSEDRTTEYEVIYSRDWERADPTPPQFTLDLSAQTLGSDTSGIDYFLQVRDLEVSLPVHVEVRGVNIDDNDGLGPMLRGVDESLAAFVGTNDYQGESDDGGLESLVYFEGVPDDYFSGIRLLDLGDAADTYEPQRLGLSYDGDNIEVYIGGLVRGSFELGDVEIETAGLASLACNGSPGCQFDYLFIGSEQLNPAPDLWSTEVSADVSEETAF